MIRTDDAPGEATHYLLRVEQQLDDLDPRLRPALVHDLHEHLTEVAAEPGASLEARLGPPEVYAAELRAAAGLPPRWTPPVAPPAVARDGRSPRAERTFRLAAAAVAAAALLAGFTLRSPAAEPVVTVPVPDVVGLDAEAADDALEAVGLDLAVSRPGTVEAQNPPAGSVASSGSVIIVWTE